MPRFAYIAKTEPNKTVHGALDAESREDAVNQLTRMGHFPVSVTLEEIGSLDRGLLSLRKVTSKDIVLFSHQLSSLIEAGITVISALDIVQNQTEHKYLKAVLRDVANRVKDGDSLSKSMEAYPNVFSNLYSAMIRTGESSGNLVFALKSLVDFLEKEENFRNSVRSSLVYPAFVFSVSALTVVTLLVFVIPRLVTMFEDMGQMLPLPTRLLIDISSFMRNYWWFLLAVILAAVFMFNRIISNPKGRLSWDRLKLNLAVIGPITIKTEMSHLMRMLSLLLSSGVPIMTSLDISKSIIANEVLRLELEKIKEQIGKGSSLSVCFRGSGVFPEFVTNLVSIGEETGSLDKSLMRIANDYGREVDAALKTMTALIEPVIILVMGLIVGFIVLAMLLPIFQINLIVR